MCLRDLLVVLENTTMLKIIVDGVGCIYTGTADHAPLAGAHRYEVAKIFNHHPHMTVLTVEEG